MLQFLDETLRDGPQSLWATRMRTETMLEACSFLDQCGFAKACVISGASFETAVKFLKDDPWERIRLVRGCLPNTAIDVLIRSRNLFGWSRYPDEIVELLFRCLKRCGADWLKVFDGLNDLDAIAAHFRIAKELGFRTSGMLAFSISPVHTDQYYESKARQLVAHGVDSITMVDASGILTAPRTESLLRALKRATRGKTPIEFYAHACMGLSHESYRAALKVGIDLATTAAEPLANGDSLPSTRDIAMIAEELGIATNLDPDAVARLDDYMHWATYAEDKPTGNRVTFDPIAYERFVEHQIPGGMMSNFQKQLAEIGMLDRVGEVLDEAGRVRAELGYPIMVTPFSQFVGVQATFNVVQKERYKTIPKELTLYARGYYGAPQAPIDPNVLDRIFRGAAVESIDAEALHGERILDRFRSQHGPFASDEELLVHLFYGRAAVASLREERRAVLKAPTVKQPLRILLEALARDASLESLSVAKDNLTLEIE
jgi:pyruvate/oxaloacetate carboxyltransferase